MVARINYFGAVGLLEALHPHLVDGELKAAVAISSNSATAVPVDDPAFVEACLAGDEERAATLAEIMDGEAGLRTLQARARAQGAPSGGGMGAGGSDQCGRAGAGAHSAHRSCARSIR